MWGLSADQLTHALAITAYHGPRVADLTLSQDMGANVKESIPWSVVAGMTAAVLAEQGFSGCRDALDIEERFDPVVALDGLGDGFLILRTYFKRYSACRWIHSAVESLLAIMREENLSPEEIQEIRVETFRQAASLDNLADPPTLESAQYSVPYCLGVVETLGEEALVPLSAESLHYSHAVKLAEKVTVKWMKEMDSDFPTQVPARVFVNTVRGNFDTLVALPWGEPDHPPDRADLVAKFHALAAQRIPEHRATAVVAAVENLKDGPLDPLLDLLFGSDDGNIKAQEKSHDTVS